MASGPGVWTWSRGSRDTEPQSQRPRACEAAPGQLRSSSRSPPGTHLPHGIQQGCFNAAVASSIVQKGQVPPEDGETAGRGGGECTSCSELRHALPPGGRGRVGACVLSAASQSSWVGGARVRAVASVVSDASRPHGQPARFLGPCDSPCKKTGVGLPCPPPGEPPDPGIEPASPEPPALQVGSLSLRHLGSPG